MANKSSNKSKSTNPYSGLSDLAKKSKDSMDKALNNYSSSQTKNINNTLEQTKKEYTQKKTEADNDAATQSRAANTDYLKSINPYGAGAEAQASAGLSGSGYSESTKSANYNTMQNRVAIAKSTADKAKLSYDNQIAQANLQKNSQLAELAYNTMAQKAENMNNYFNNRLNITNGNTNYKLGNSQLKISKDQLKLQKDELKFNKKQAKKNR